ncbi:MAG: O-antigen ligase family protein [Candidatus Wallbacteria bacterium]|nr:O-antigen ligase family protein [Candidatus Wallbacteria bacterium]
MLALAAAGPLLASVNTVGYLAVSVVVLAASGAALLVGELCFPAGSGPLLALWVTWLAFLPASLVWAPCFHGSALAVAKLAALHLAALGVGLSRLARARRHTLLFVCLATACLVSAMGLQEVACGKEMLPGWVDPQTQSAIRARAASTFANPNLLAGYLALWLPVACGQLLEAEAPLAAGSASLLLFAGLLFTFSRGGWLGGALGVAAFAWTCRGHPGARRLRVTAAGATLIALLGAGQVAERASSVGKAGELGIHQRIELYRGVLACIRARPLSGAGFNGFETVYPRHRLVGGYYPLDAHNDLLHVAVEAGLPGALLYSALLAALLVIAFRACAGGADATGAGLACGLLGATGASMFMGSFRYLGMQLPFWFAAALVVARRPAESPSPRPLRWRWLTLPVAAAAAVYWMLSWATDPAAREPATSPASAVQTGLAWMPWRHELHLLLGRLLARAGKPEEALAELEKAQKLDPLQSDYARWKAEVLAGADRLQAALSEADRALEGDPHSEEYLLLKGRLLIRAGRLKEAASVLEGALATNEQYLQINRVLYPKVFAELAWIYERLGRNADAAALSERARKLYGEPGR